MKARDAIKVCVLLVLVVALAASCRTATEITLVFSTDVSCADVHGTTVTVGRLGEVEEKAPTTSSTFCGASGDLGVLVLVPSGSNEDVVAVKIVAGVGRDAETCVPPYGKGCIVARRSMQYVPHTGLRVAVPLRAACDGVPCGQTETCVSGACVGATIGDPSACTGPPACNEGSLGPSPGADGGADGSGVDGSVDAGADGSPSGPPGYHDMTDPSFWSAFDVSTVNTGAKAFEGAAFDGRYVYFVPNRTGTSGLVTRYDTQAPFATGGSWSTFDATTVNAGAKGFVGSAFDGRYVHFVPNRNGFSTSGIATRYDTQGAFGTGASWSTFDTTTVNAGAAGFGGATFDGRYVYFAPQGSTGTVARFDTQAPFATGASWATFNSTAAASGSWGYWGAAFDGRYVYFVPSVNVGTFNSVLLRYDSQAPFAAGASWTSLDVRTGVPGASNFVGAAFDGRYLYLVPGQLTGVAARYDTQAPFATVASWTGFDTTTLKAGAKGFQGGAFDGRYIYFVPAANSAPDGLVVRYDTQAPFATGASWSTFDMTTVNAGAAGFNGAAFDGRYLYFVPTFGSIVTRFDAKTPPSMPKLPGFNGSFL